MILVRTPFRVSLFGGGSDYPEYYRTAPRGGATLGFALDRYCYLAVRRLPPFFEHKHRIVYSAIELVNDLKEIKHPTVRAVLQHVGPPFGIEITHSSDLPARAGLGSSSSFTVGLLHALLTLWCGFESGPMFLAEQATMIEQSIETVGSQDQLFAALGGFRCFRFGPGDDIRVESIPVRHDLLNHLLLAYTGTSRYAPMIASAQMNRLSDNLPALERLRDMVDDALAVLADRRSPPTHLGELLHEAWQLKRSLAPEVSSLEIDEIYQTARSAGATGGKLLGAGGGGFFLLLAPPSCHAAIREALHKLVFVQIGIDDRGSTILMNDT